MTEYKYADWLDTHAKKKSIMEKLERSLVPFQLFADIDFASIAEGYYAEVEYNGNVYGCQLLSKSVSYERDVFHFQLSKVKIDNSWEDILMGYSDYKVVLQDGEIVTIYPFQEDYFADIIGMFESGKYSCLYKTRTLYIKNLLARYILLKLINAHKPNMSILYSVRQKWEVIPVLAGLESREWIMYAFSKKEANDLARHYQGKCGKLTVVYFINQNFENEYRNYNFNAPDAQVISIKQFYRDLGLPYKERNIIERQIFFLIEMLYEKRMDWNIEKLRTKIMKAPDFADKDIQWMDVPKMLVEDALNVLVEDYNNPYDVFHLMCSANLINTYTNRYKDRNKLEINKKNKTSKNARADLNKRVHIMYGFKVRVMNTIISLLKNRSRFLKVAFAHVFGSQEYTLLADVKVDGRDYQFKFRGITPKYIEQLHAVGVRDNGKFNPIRLQPIAPALYLYSYCLKWN